MNGVLYLFLLQTCTNRVIGVLLSDELHWGAVTDEQAVKGSCSRREMPRPLFLAVKASHSLSVSLRASLPVRCSLVVTHSAS